MTVTTIDEETPLLPEQQKKKPTPLPWAQFSILLVLQLAEPLTNQVIYPFLPQVSTSATESVNQKADWICILFSLSETSVSRTETRPGWDTMLEFWWVPSACLTSVPAR